ncbi:type II toxin-antitoxin system HipA family toxin [Methylotenera sp.]|uniref:type II toxin-antitoxin system HipA family toxin n=1 Tax=Methylotenera sp. TaxID=2051956 RepID=UPI0024898BF6|nr:type II toxin-antitoxin system HipA family toxin [Methylotenera sp.]MDI1297724.1 type II toxin-antitoxin system HipA family toxin [Methylotenera sp.]
MTSDRKVYVGLATEPHQVVTPVCLLKLVRRGVVESGEYAYGKQYLASPAAIPLNNEHMPLSNSAMALPERRLRDGGALPLTFRDALPDSWGRRVLEAQYGRTLDDIDALLMTNADRVGAMVFSESLPIEVDQAETNLLELEEMSDAIKMLELAMDIPPEMRRLLQRGGTLGGARPKATFIHENRRWIAKFPALADDHDVELLEICLLKLAALCGIEVSPSRLESIQSGHVILVSRFDRVGNIDNERRIHYLSASALLNVSYESNGGSYVEFAQVIRKISSNPTHDLDQLYRRLVFNLIVDNTDDHVKNHGMLHVGDGQYRLAPAFDIVMQLQNLGYQELAIFAGNNVSSLRLATEAAPYFGFKKEDAENIIHSIQEIALRELIAIAEHFGASTPLKERIKRCLNRQRELINNQ